MERWQNPSPGDLDDLLPAVSADDPQAAIAEAATAFPAWAARPLAERIGWLRELQAHIRAESESLAHLIARETGKPLTEARGELGAVVAKFDLSIADAERYLADSPVTDGPHPALVRHRPRGVAAVIAPFNFPIHLGHGAAVAYLLAGSPVLFKPSPLAAVTGGTYGAIMAAGLPRGVFQIVQGGGDVGRALCLDPAVRNVCFTGSSPVGTALARELSADYSKSLALELGGKNATLVFADAPLAAAADAVADATCLTAGQRCNATSRVFVAESVLDDFLAALRPSLARYAPGSPLDERTKLGPVISAAAADRYRRLTALPAGEWIVPGTVPATVGGKRGHFVQPAVVLCRDASALAASRLQTEEAFCPILTVIPFRDEAEVIARHNEIPFGLTASIFTEDEATFDRVGRALPVGNLYRNLPTTFSPSTLPFGGLGVSGNGKPGARGFVRFAADEQAVQWREK